MTVPTFDIDEFKPKQLARVFGVTAATFKNTPELQQIFEDLYAEAAEGKLIRRLTFSWLRELHMVPWATRLLH